MDAIFNFPTIITEKETPPFESTITYFSWRNVTFRGAGMKTSSSVKCKANTSAYIIWGRNCNSDFIDDEFLYMMKDLAVQDYSDQRLGETWSTRGSGAIYFTWKATTGNFSMKIEITNTLSNYLPYTFDLYCIIWQE